MEIDDAKINVVKADRVLAEVVRILSVEPIQDASRIEKAEVLGWDVVIKLDEFKVGDLAIYFSIGSMIDKNTPIPSRLEGKPLLTRKIYRVISQGLLGPLEWVIPYGVDISTLVEGYDLTEVMKVKKFVPKEEIDVYVDDPTRAAFPSCVPKTDEERIQNMTKSYYKFENQEVILTEKYDGTSTTYCAINNEVLICSRNNVLLEPTKTTTHYFIICERYNLKESMINLKRNIAIQGEIIGPKINGNRHKLSDVEFYVFNVYDIDVRSFLNYDEVVKICDCLHLKMVPLVYKGKMKKEWLGKEGMKQLLDLADSLRYDDGKGGKLDTPAEGFVLKTNNPTGYPNVSCKIISNSYLIKYKL